MKTIFFILLSIFSLESAACIVGPPCGLCSGDDLIEKTDNIILVKLIDESHSEIIEVLKGNKLKLGHFGKRLSYNGLHYGSDFDGHRDIFFWELDIGRSESGSCDGPEQTYIPGEMYLAFLGQRGAKKHAEIIRDFDDKWYLYVKNKISTPQFDHHSLLTQSNEFKNYSHIGTWLLDAERTYNNMSEDMKEINSYLLKEKNIMKFTNSSIKSLRYDSDGNLLETKSYEYDYKKFNQYLITHLPIGNSPSVYKFENKNSMMFMDENRTKLYFVKTHNQSLKDGTAQSAAP